MKSLSKQRKAALDAALSQPNDFEQVLSIHGYVIVNKNVLQGLCKLVNKQLMGKKCKFKN